MKILFVIRDVEYIDPMGIMLLSALAKREGHATGLHVMAKGGLKKRLKSFRPDIAAFSAKTGEHKYYLAANKEIKKSYKNIFTVIGGPHATFFPELILKQPFDALCSGEGDDAWPELLRAIDRRGSIDSIPNIVTQANFPASGRPAMRPRRTTLDDLPFLDRGLCSQTRLGGFPMRSFMTGRGCPYQCAYCFNHRYNELYANHGPVRVRMSVDRVIAELKELKLKHKAGFIKFYDDIFVMKDDEWLDEFAREYAMKIALPFHCLMRADLLTEGILVKLKKAGLRSISMSIESGVAAVRNGILRRAMTDEAMLRAFGLCSRHKVPTFSNTIYALPGTRLQDDIASLDLNIRCNVTFGEFPLFFPYPGTELTAYAERHGHFNGNFDALHESYQSNSPLSSFSPREKMALKNLSLLSTVCLLRPGLRDVIVNRLIKLPLTWLYFLAYYSVKAYVVKSKIYPVKLSLANAIRSMTESFKLERVKHFGHGASGRT